MDGRDGRDGEETERHVRFRLPDAVLALPDEERTEGTWLSHENDPMPSVMMEVPGAGEFVRVLMPVRLDDGTTITYGMWLAVNPSELHRVFGEWWAPTYPDLRVHGLLANALPRIPVSGVEVVATVRNPEHTPYVTESADPFVAQLLTEPQPVADHP